MTADLFERVESSPDERSERGLANTVPVRLPVKSSILFLACHQVVPKTYCWPAVVELPWPRMFSGWQPGKAPGEVRLVRQTVLPVAGSVTASIAA